MQTINRATILGRLGQDPQSRALPNGGNVVSLSVATDESYTRDDGSKVEATEWHRVSVFGRSAEWCMKSLKKGDAVLVEGPIVTRSWEKDGVKQHSTEIKGLRVTGFSSGGGKRAEDGGGSYGGRPADQGGTSSYYGGGQAAGPAKGPDEDIPF